MEKLDWDKEEQKFKEIFSPILAINPEQAAMRRGRQQIFSYSRYRYNNWFTFSWLQVTPVVTFAVLVLLVGVGSRINEDPITEVYAMETESALIYEDISDAQMQIDEEGEIIGLDWDSDA